MLGASGAQCWAGTSGASLNIFFGLFRIFSLLYIGNAFFGIFLTKQSYCSHASAVSPASLLWSSHHPSPGHPTMKGKVTRIPPRTHSSPLSLRPDRAPHFRSPQHDSGYLCLYPPGVYLGGLPQLTCTLVLPCPVPVIPVHLSPKRNTNRTAQQNPAV